MELCPCGSEKQFSECCEPYIKGEKIPETAEQLMRSRYSAYTIADVDYIFNTTHPDHREDYDEKGTREWAETSTWQGLEIINTKENGTDGDECYVEFLAKYTTDKGLKQNHHELSLFQKVDGKWYFTDGQGVTPKQYVRETPKVGRNEPCPCGSGKKFKKCCG